MSLIEAPAPNPRPAPSDESEELVIAPTSAPLSATDAGGRGSRVEHGGGFRWPWRHARLPLIGGLLIVLAAAAVFVLLLPSSLVEKTRAALPPVLAPSAETPADQAVAGFPPTRADTTETAQPPPYQAMQVTLARQAAREQLARFSELQLRLEDELNVDAWGTDAVRAGEDMALAGDGLFRQEDYAGANQEYAAAVAALERLWVEGQARFESALGAAEAALAALDQQTALAALEQAAAVRPDDPRIAAGRARAELLPRLSELVLDSDRALLRGDHEQALRLLEEARGLAPAAPMIAERFQRHAAARRQARRVERLSNAFDALARNDHETALRRFEDLLATNPQDAPALAGKQQAERHGVLATLATLRDAADQDAREENWEAALTGYDEALAIDDALQFAKRGREQVRQRLAVANAMDRIINDPPLLSSNAEFDAARELLARGEAVATAAGSEKLDARVDRLRQLLEESAVPVPLVLTSDGVTEVVIHKVRAMGAFTRVELALRPGRYVIVGSSDGCRDIRKEIVLAANMAPVDIRCSERI